MDINTLDIKTVKYKKDGQLTIGKRFYRADSLLEWVMKWSLYDTAPIFVGVENDGVRRLEYDSTQEWKYPLAEIIRGVAADYKQNVYFCHDDGTTGNVVKLAKDGDQQYSFGVHARPRSIAVDMDEYVYVGLSGGGLVKADSTGSEVWEISHADSQHVLVVDVDSIGNIYTGSANGVVSKIDSAGNVLWEYMGFEGSDVNGVGVDVDGNIYAGSDDEKVHKIDSNGNKVWEYTTEFHSRVKALTVDLNGNVYAGYRSHLTTDYARVHKINSAGSYVWEWVKHTNNQAHSLAIDPEGMLYVTFYWSGILNKLDPDGNEVWEYTDMDDGPIADVFPGRVGAFHSVW